MSKAAVFSTLAAACACLSACALAMDDLSTRPAPSDSASPAATASTPSAPPASVAGDDKDGGPDNSIGVTLPSPLDAGPALGAGCAVTELVGQQAHSEGPGSGWASAMNALADDDAKAETGLSVNNRDSALLVVNQLEVAAGPSIPSAATIKGVFVDVDRSSGSTCILGREIALRLANEPSPRTKALASAWDQPARFGDANDLWGGTSIASQAFSNGNTAVTIGLHFEGDRSSCGDQTRIGRIDVVHVSVAWCP